MTDDRETSGQLQVRDDGPAGLKGSGGAGDVGKETWATVDRWLAYQLWQSRVPGAQVAVASRGRLVFSKAYGLADIDQNIDMTTSHLFHIASQSKTFTATVILRLVEQGAMRTEDTVGSLVVELAGYEIGDVTVRELLSHTAGLLRDGDDADCWQGLKAFPDKPELLNLLRHDLKRSPGELFAYSNLGYALLGVVIETVTGMTYADAVDKHVVERLGLRNTRGRHLPERVADYATGYSGLHAAATRAPRPSIDTQALDPAAGLTSTAEDLASYYSAHARGNGQLLSDRTKRRMQEAVYPTDPTKPHGQTYGLGMDAEDIGDRRVIGHGGGYPGHTTRTMVDFESGLVVTALTNAIDGPANTLVSGVIKILDDANAHPGEPDPAAVTHTGRWASAWGVTDIAASGNRLLGLHPGDSDPVMGADVLAVDSADQLHIITGSGFGSVGEAVTFSSDETMRYGATSMRRLDDLPNR